MPTRSSVIKLAAGAVLMAVFAIGCDGDGPFSPGEFRLAEVHSGVDVDSSAFSDGSSFAPGYANGSIQSDEATFDWNCSLPENFLCYKIFVQRAGFPEVLASCINDFDERSFVMTSLNQDTWYQLRIERLDRSGMHEGETFSVKTARWQAPSSVLASGLSPNLVAVSWQDNSESEQHFTVTLEMYNSDTGNYDYVSSEEAPANGVSIDISIPDAGRIYRFGVSAQSGYETSTSVSYSQDYLALFEQVTALHAQQASNSRIVHLTWNDNSTLETGYEIERSINSNDIEDYVPVANLGINSSEWEDQDTTATVTGDVLQYRVRAYNSFGETIYTNWSTISLTLVAPTFTPNPEIYVYDGYSDTQYLNSNDTHVYYFYGSDDLDVDLCPGQGDQNLGVRIWTSVGVFIGEFNAYSQGNCEYVADITQSQDYILEVYDSNNVAASYYISIY